MKALENLISSFTGERERTRTLLLLFISIATPAIYDYGSRSRRRLIIMILALESFVFRLESSAICVEQKNCRLFFARLIFSVFSFCAAQRASSGPPKRADIEWKYH